MLLGPAHQEGPHVDEAGGIDVGVLPAEAALPQPERLGTVGVSHHGHPGKGGAVGGRWGQQSVGPLGSLLRKHVDRWV